MCPFLVIHSTTDTEQSRAEQSREEQSRAEQSRVEEWWACGLSYRPDDAALLQVGGGWVGCLYTSCLPPYAPALLVVGEGSVELSVVCMCSSPGSGA